MDESRLSKPLHLETPLLWSQPLSEKTGMNVWLKLENAQNSGSYKIRGIGKFCQEAVKKGAKHLVSSSGGNAGIAATYAGKKLQVPCTVVVPEPTVPLMKEKIKLDASHLEVFGASWDEANIKALEICKREQDAVLVHPFDHPDIWEGHSTMIDEIHLQLQGKRPDVVVLSVGGGGLMCGVLQGMHKYGWGDVPLVALETEGAKSFNICVESGQFKGLESINTVAKTLGVKHICKRAFDWIKEHKLIYSKVVSDTQAVDACLRFADDHRFLVSASAGAALAPVYGDILTDMQKDGTLPRGKLEVVIIVCGGNEVNLKELEVWRKMFNL
jgi:L-serine/L-threonine ammonia-lyase